MYREDKTTQMAARFLEKTGHKMPYILLIKLLYLADKQMLVTRGKPITYDRWVSMKCGPVLSNTYNLIKDAQGEERNTYWSRYIRTEGYDAVLTDNPGSTALSVAEDRIIDEVFVRWGDQDKWDVVKATHDLAEWTDPGESCLPITYEEVLRIEGLSADEIADVLDNIEGQGVAERLATA